MPQACRRPANERSHVCACRRAELPNATGATSRPRDMSTPRYRAPLLGTGPARRRRASWLGPSKSRTCGLRNEATMIYEAHLSAIVMILRVAYGFAHICLAPLVYFCCLIVRFLFFLFSIFPTAILLLPSPLLLYIFIPRVFSYLVRAEARYEIRKITLPGDVRIGDGHGATHP